jgi:hypothetical protein
MYEYLEQKNSILETQILWISSTVPPVKCVVCRLIFQPREMKYVALNLIFIQYRERTNEAFYFRHKSPFYPIFFKFFQLKLSETLQHLAFL